MRCLELVDVVVEFRSSGDGASILRVLEVVAAERASRTGAILRVALASCACSLSRASTSLGSETVAPAQVSCVGVGGVAGWGAANLISVAVAAQRVSRTGAVPRVMLASCARAVLSLSTSLNSEAAAVAQISCVGDGGAAVMCGVRQV